MSGLSWVEYAKLAIYYGAWAYIPAAGLFLYGFSRLNGAARLVAALVFAGLTILAYARFVEPRLLVVRDQEIVLKRCFPEAGAVRLAVFADTHIGLFGNATPIGSIAPAVDALDADIVLIPGDFTYFLDPAQFDETFRPLAQIKAPVYAVLGNHDVGFPGPDVGAPLSESLKRIGLKNIENNRVNAGPIELVGLSDLWQGEQDLSLLDRSSRAPRIVITHNPDTALVMPPRANFDLMIAGHTHGGQINLGPLTCLLVPMACRVVRDGYGETDDGRAVFVTTGTGMVGLPMRFRMPPRIDVVTVRFNMCARNGA